MPLQDIVCARIELACRKSQSKSPGSRTGALPDSNFCCG
jgi:hypothetical protein